MLEDVTPPVTPDDAGLNSAPAVLQQQYEPSSVPPSGFSESSFATLFPLLTFFFSAS